MASPLVDQFRKGGVSRDVRLTAAAGALPLKPMDQLELLYLLTRDRDDEVRDKADASLRQVKVENLQNVLKDTSANPKVLEYFGTRLEDPDLLELIGLDPLSWTPNPLGDRSPRCQSRETDTRPSSGAKW